MRLMFFCAFGHGATRLLLPKARHARENGYDVSFAFSPGPDVDVVRAEGFEVHPIHVAKAIRPLADLASVRAAVRLLRDVRPDILSTHFAKGGAIARIAARIVGVPYVLYSPHGFAFTSDERNARFWVYASVERFLSRWTDVIMTQTTDDARLAGELGFRARQGSPIVIGNGIDLSRFDPTEVAPELGLRKRLGLGPSTRVLTSFARINEVKGLRDLVHALERVSDLDWVLLHYGHVEDQPLARWLEERLAANGLKERVVFNGLTDAAPQILAETDWFVLPSHIEGMPRSLIEAQAMGVPAVATRIRGSRDIVADGETGYLVPSRDPAALAAALRRALELAPSQRRKMGEAAMRRAQSRFDEELVKARLLAIYRRRFDALPEGLQPVRVPRR